MTQREERIWSALLALLPVASFVAQWRLSAAAGTGDIFWRHWTVVVVDWLFVPINWLIVPAIDWRRGGTIFLAALVGVAGNLAAHALWQANGLDAGHLIDPHGALLPAGWVHLAFGCVETTLIASYFFARRAASGAARLLDLLLLAYFLGVAAAGWAMHGRLTASDAALLFTGLFFLFAWPRLSRQ